MASLALLASSHLTLLFSRAPPRNAWLRPPSKPLSLARMFPRSTPLSFSVGSSPGGGAGGVSDEWGEKSAWDKPGPPSSDPPKDDDEWGTDADSGKTSIEITDEWGEKDVVAPEPPSNPDPPKDEDEWGNGSIPATSEDAPSSGEDAAEKLGDLKRCIVDSVYGTELGFRASAEVRAEVLELVNQLEALNPNPNPIEKPELLDGNWILLCGSELSYKMRITMQEHANRYTSYSELLPLLAVGSTPFLKVKKISQEINSSTQTIINATTLSSPAASFSFSASASFEVRSPSRIQVQFKEGTFQPPEVSSTIDLPDQVDIFGQKISLGPVRQALNPLQSVFLNIARTLSGQPPLKVPIPSGNRAASWLLTTYLDEDFRISRGDGGLFVLAKEGSPLLDLI